MTAAAPSTLKRDIAAIYGLGIVLVFVVISILFVGYLEWSFGGKGPPVLTTRLFLSRHGNYHGLTVEVPIGLGLEHRKDRLFIWRRWPAYRIAHTTTFVQLVHSDSAGFAERWAARDSICVHAEKECRLETVIAPSGQGYLCDNHRGSPADSGETSLITVCHNDAAQIFALIGCDGSDCAEYRDLVARIFATWQPNPTS
jgi:hypothetical protein